MYRASENHVFTLSSFLTLYTQKSQGLALAVPTGRAAVLPSPPSLSWSFLTKCPFSSSSAACAVVVLNQGNNMAENKASHFAHHLLHLVHHAASQKQALTHFRGRWAWRGEGCWNCSSIEEIAARPCIGISAQGVARLKNDLFLVIAIGGVTQSDHIPSLVLLMATQMLP